MKIYNEKHDVFINTQFTPITVDNQTPVVGQPWPHRATVMNVELHVQMDYEGNSFKKIFLPKETIVDIAKLIVTAEENSTIRPCDGDDLPF